MTRLNYYDVNHLVFISPTAIFVFNVMITVLELAVHHSELLELGTVTIRTGTGR